MRDIDPVQVSGIVLWYAEKIQVVALLLIAYLKENTGVKQISGVLPNGGIHLTRGSKSWTCTCVLLLRQSICHRQCW